MCGFAARPSPTALWFLHDVKVFIRRMLAYVQASFMNSTALPTPAEEFTQDLLRSCQTSDVSEKSRLNLPSTSDLWRTLDDYFKASVVPTVLETASVDRKYAVLVDCIHQACSSCLGLSLRCGDRRCYYKHRSTKFKKAMLSLH